MLSTETRRLYTECLEAPPGHRFDRGIATTFTLSLETLLVLPFSLAGLGTAEPELLLADPVALLESLQETGNRLAVFCHDGYIAVPPREQALYGLLDRCVVPVRAPRRQGLFHPKLWLLRFVDEAGGAILRAVVLSRNLTFNRELGHGAVPRGRAHRPPGAGQRGAGRPRGPSSEARDPAARRPARGPGGAPGRGGRAHAVRYAGAVPVGPRVPRNRGAAGQGRRDVPPDGRGHGDPGNSACPRSCPPTRSSARADRGRRADPGVARRVARAGARGGARRLAGADAERRGGHRRDGGRGRGGGQPGGRRDATDGTAREDCGHRGPQAAGVVVD